MSHTETIADTDITATNPVTTVEEGTDHKTTGIAAKAAAVEPT